MSQEFDNKVLGLVKQKRFYLCEYIKGFENFKEQLPTDKKNEHVLKVWKKFEMKATKNYHNLHSKYHVLLLADVFEKFRNRKSKSYGICLSQHLRAPALSWDAMLNITKVKLEPISIAGMFSFF